MSLAKKIFSLFLLSAFALSSIGIGVHKHYCMGYLAEVSLYIPSNPCEMEEGEMSCHKKKKSCCEDEYQFAQLEQDLQKKETSQLKWNDAFKLLESPLVEWSIGNTSIDQTIYSRSKDPPRIRREALYLLYQRYTLYG